MVNAMLRTVLSLLAMLVCAVAGLGACASQPKSSRLGVDDIEFTAKELAFKLGSSDLVMDRTPSSPRMVIAIHKVENLSTDVIPEGDRWYIMARVRSSQSVDTIARVRNIAFVIPAEHLRDSSMLTELDREVGAGRAPTHEMTATFRSATRSAGRDRTDLYLCELRVTDLATGQVAWTDIVEFKKTAFGRAYD